MVASLVPYGRNDHRTLRCAGHEDAHHRCRDCRRLRRRLDRFSRRRCRTDDAGSALRVRPDVSQAVAGDVGHRSDWRPRRRPPRSPLCRAAAGRTADQRTILGRRRHAAQGGLLHSRTARPRVRSDRCARALMGRSGLRLRLAADRARRLRRSQGCRVAGGQRGQGCAAAEVHERRKVPRSVRQARHERRQRRHEEHGHAGQPHRRSGDQRGLRRGRLRQPPGHRARRRHVRLQADVGGLRESSGRCRSRTLQP